MSQTTYSNDLPIASPGLIGDGATVLTRKTGSATIQPGRGLIAESGVAGGVVLPSANTDVISGVSGYNPRRENAASGDNPYADNEVFPFVVEGPVAVKVEEAVTTDDDVYVRVDGEVEVFTITWDGNFVTSNTINGSINGVAISEVTFTSDQATTIAAVAAAIEALDTVDTAEVTDTNEITVTGATKGLDISTNATFTVAAGAGQADDTIANVSGPSTGTEAGLFRTDDDDVGNGALAVQVASARYLTNASAGEAAWILLNLP